jgi:hypothetical protein
MSGRDEASTNAASNAGRFVNLLARLLRDLVA